MIELTTRTLVGRLVLSLGNILGKGGFSRCVTSMIAARRAANSPVVEMAAVMMMMMMMIRVRVSTTMSVNGGAKEELDRSRKGFHHLLHCFDKLEKYEINKKSAQRVL